MPQLSSVERNTELNQFFALFVGRSGDGKSFAEASFPQPMYVWDFDRRIDGMADAKSAGIDISKIEYDYYPPTTQGFVKMNKKLEHLEMQRLANGICEYQTMIADSITNYARLAVVYSLGETRGKNVGVMRVQGPGDYAFETNATHQFFDELRANNCNVIASAHIVDKWGKPKNAENEYAPAEIIGEKLSIRDNLGENILTYFSNVFRFSREVVRDKQRFFVDFATDLAKNSYGIPPGKWDITDKNFYEFFKELILAAKEDKLEEFRKKQ